jgi:hypothetical protein
MTENQKWVFLKALIVTLIIFNIGVYMGYKLEASRADKINKIYLESELLLLDQEIQRQAFDLINLNCDKAIQANINFADKIFEEALGEIYHYEQANKINNAIIFQHQRFDLLRSLFWMNSIKIKEKCNSNYNNIVYFYDYLEPTFVQQGKQNFFSNFLEEIKNEKGDKVMLIPIAGDNNLPSIDLLLEKYQITELPTILINEKIKLTEVNSKEDILKYLN